LLDLVFPPKCVCGKWGTLLCDRCFRLIDFKATQTCPICRKISENGKTCRSCRSRSQLTGVMIFGEHKGVIKKMIWEYKYGFIKELADPLSEIICLKFKKFIEEKKPILTFVPASKKRMKWRGFNQSELLALEIGKRSRLEVVCLLSKDNDSKSQVGLSRKERLKNMKGKFSFTGSRVKNKRVIIIDDVYTSGATLEECALILRKNGFREVYGLVLTRD